MNPKEKFIVNLRKLIEEYEDLTGSTNDSFKFELSQEIAKGDIYKLNDFIDLLEWASYIDRSIDQGDWTSKNGAKRTIPKRKQFVILQKDLID